MADYGTPSVFSCWAMVAQKGPRQGVRNLEKSIYFCFFLKKGPAGGHPRMALRKQNVQNISEKTILGTIALGALEGPLGVAHFCMCAPWVLKWGFAIELQTV